MTHEVTPEILEKIEAGASRGLTNEQIAAYIGWAPSTLYYKIQKEREAADEVNESGDVDACHEAKSGISETIKRGKARGVANIANALYEKAVNGDNTAMIFFLKNRDSDNWKDVHHNSVTGANGDRLIPKEQPSVEEIKSELERRGLPTEMLDV